MSARRIQPASGPVERSRRADGELYTDQWTSSDCLRVLRRHLGHLLAAASLGFAFAALLSGLHPKVYRSRIALEVDALNENFLDFRNVYPAVTPSADTAGLLQTQAEIFEQDELLERVARQLQLGKRPEYNGAAGIAERLREDIRVEPSRNSRILQIACDARDPDLAASLCNVLANEGIAHQIAARERIARDTWQSLQPRLADLRSAIAGIKAPGGPVALQREIYRRSYESLLQKAGEALVASHVPQAGIRILGPAQPPPRPFKPNFPLNATIGTIGGLLLGVAWVMLRADNRSVLREPGEAALHLRVPELGAIPRVKRTASLSSEEQADALSESFRAASLSIVSATADGRRRRTLVVTSAWPMEGKTTVVRYLGQALAETSERVLLIDGDTRRPGLHKLFDEANSWGLTDVLREPNAIDELPVDVIVKKTSVPHLYLLPSGTYSDKIFSLLATERMSRLWSRFQEAFDYVLVDAPPCLEFAHARILAHRAGEVLLVLRANHTHRRAAQAVIDRVRLDGIPVIGVVLNQWDQRRSFVYRRSDPGEAWRGGVL